MCANSFDCRLLKLILKRWSLISIYVGGGGMAIGHV